jgi:hypothetical protein
MQFLHHVLPPIGPYCFTLIKNGVVNQQFIDSIPTDDELAEFITDHANCDSYFALASFQTPTKRTQANVAKLKALWLDLDIGGKSTYSNKDAARQALVAFYKAAGLPKPTVVDSGGGYHVYWTLTRAIDVAEWKALVLALLNKATEHNFSIKDVGVSKDCARILRLPNSYNHKFEEPRQVEIKTVGVPTDPDTLRELLNAGPAVPLLPKVITNLTSAAASQLSPLTRSLMAHTGQQYGPVINRSLAGTGCVQLANGYLNQEDISGLHWWALLSIPQFTEQRQDAVHNLSYQHSNYSVAATLFKVERTDGPYACAKISEHRPELCTACSHYGSITYPFLLHRPNPDGRGDGQPRPEEDIARTGLPPIVYPYLPGARAGIYVKSFIPNKDGGGSMAIKHVYNHTFFVSGRCLDPNEGEVVHMKLIRPHDGPKDFSVPLAEITAKEKCREHFSKQGMAADAFKMKMLMDYTTEFCSYLQEVDKADNVRAQFGWHDNDSCFVVGDREIRKDGVFYSMPSGDTLQVVMSFTKVGTLAAWQTVAERYAGPNNEVRAFALLVGLGCPMFKFLGYGGAILHLTNTLSGVGKSAAQGLALSVWGHPDKGMSLLKDTLNMRLHRLGVMNNVVFCIDEITLMNEEEVGTLAYSISQGRGKGRMEASANRERVNTSTWSVPCITSGNSNIHDILKANSMNSDGEVMRVLEMRVEPITGISKEESDRLFIDVLQNNYGHAGEIIVQYILNHKDECRTRLKTIQKEFDLAMGYGNPERYYSLLTTTALWGGEIANLLGLIDIPLEPIVTYLKHLSTETRQEARTPEQISGNTLGTFINEHAGNHTLVIDMRPSNIPGDLRPAVQMPRGELMIRIETDTKKLFISSTSLRSWCSKKRVSYNDMVAELKTNGALLTMGNVKLGEGTATSSPAVRALILDKVILDGMGL